jgi:uncharacterized protein (UPF0332 family)
MSYDWTLFHKFAYDIYKNQTFGDKETVYRVVISRAYYAAFHAAKEFVEQNNLKASVKRNSHEDVVDSLISANKSDLSFTNKCHTMGNRLDRIRRDRILADYNEKIQISDKEAREALSIARKIIAETV